MSVDQIVALLGRPSTDPSVGAMLDAHGLRWRPELDDEDLDKFTDWFPVADQGIEFGFMDEAYLRAREPSLRRCLPLIFHEVIFYDRHPSIRPYLGDLPYGLAFDTDRATVRQRLASTSRPLRSYVRDVWELPECRLIVSYCDDDSRIADLICCLREEPWPVGDGPLPPHPSAATIAGLLGQPVDSEAFKRAFMPLGTSYAAADGGGTIDLRTEFGFDMHVDAPVTEPGLPPTTSPIFDSITFYRDRELDARGWRGELPFGLSFDDSPVQALAKVAAAPLEHHDRHLDGWALWRFEGCMLQVQYSTLENLVYRVSLFRRHLLLQDRAAAVNP